VAARPPRTGQCRGCLGWGTLAQPPYCSPCHQWRSKKTNQPGTCRRCQFPALVTPEGLCRGCILAVKESDADWYYAPDDRGRDVQLTLIMPGLGQRRAMPIGSYRKRSDGRYHPPDWARSQRSAAPADDKRICPPAIPGQLLLFRPRRSLTGEHAARISARRLAGYQELERELAAYAADHGYTRAWRQIADGMIRLALAVRDSDGDTLISLAALEDLPHLRDTVAELARRAMLLSQEPMAARRPPFGPRPRHARSAWRAARPRERCPACGQAGVRLRGNLCRACARQAGVSSLGKDCSGWVQLSMGWPEPRNGLPSAPTDRPQSREQDRAISGHLLWPGQAPLADARRDWRLVFAMLPALPALTQDSAALLADFESEALAQRWTPGIRIHTTRAMRILLSWLGTAAPIPEADVRALGTAHRDVKVRRLLWFLSSHGLLDQEPSRELSADHAAVTRLIDEIPQPMAAELRHWVAVMRGQGRRKRPPASFRTIRNYLSYASPVLCGWREHAASLREITRQDVQAAVGARTGGDAHHLIVALRRIFRALRQERLIFANPCAGISVTRAEALPVTLPPDRLAGLLDRARTPAARLAVALTALHATQPAELRAILMTDLDLPNARLAIRRRTGRHFIYLDELTLACLDSWLRERHRRWPRTPNPHLLISQQTAADTTPVAPRYIDECFAPTEASPSRLRQDRILDEARHTADPVRLMRLFGISDTTAMKYVFTAHPERQSVPGR